MTEEIRQLQEQFSANPQDPEAFLALVNCYERERLWRPLAKIYEAVASSQKGDAQKQLYSELAQRLAGIVRNFDTKSASDDSKKAIAEMCVYLGDLYINHLDNHDGAMNMYQQAFKIWNRDTTCLERARTIYERIGNWERVLVLLGLEQRVHKKEEDRTKLLISYLHTANIYADQFNNPVKALELIFEAQKINDEDPRVQVVFNRLSAHENLSDMTAEMVKRAEELVDDNPKDAAKLLARAARLENANYRGDEEQAVYYIEMAKELDGDVEAYNEIHQQILADQQQNQAYNSTQALWTADQPATNGAAPKPDDAAMFKEVEAEHSEVSEVYDEQQSTQIINLDEQGAPPLPVAADAPADEPAVEAPVEEDSSEEDPVEEDEAPISEIEELDADALEAASEPAAGPPALPPQVPEQEADEEAVELEEIEPPAQEAVSEQDEPVELEEIEPAAELQEETAALSDEELVADEDAQESDEVAQDEDVQDAPAAQEEPQEDEPVELEEIDPSEAQALEPEEDEEAFELEEVHEPTADVQEDDAEVVAEESTEDLPEDAVEEDDEIELEEIEPPEEAATDESTDESAEDVQEDAVPVEDSEPEEAPAEEAPVEESPEARAPVDGPSEIMPLAAAAPAGDVDEAAYDEACATLKKDATDLAALNVVRQYCLATGDLSTLAEKMEHSVKYLRNKDGEFDVMRDVAVLYWKDLQDMKKAEYYFKRLRYQDGEMPEVLAFYEEYFQSRGEWRKLHKHLQDQLKAMEANNPRQRELTIRLAQLSEEEMKSPEKAIDAWRTFLAQHEGDAQAKAELRRLYETHEKWPALVDYLRDELTALESGGEDTITDRVDLLLEMDTIYRDKMPGGDMHRIGILNQLLELSPDHRGGFDALRELLAGNRRFNELATLLGQQAEQAHEQGDLARAIELLTEVADLWQNDLRNVSQALPHLERILEIDNWHTPTRERLKEVYNQRRGYAELFELLDQETDHQEGDDALRAHLETLLDLAQDRLRDPEKAIPILQRLLTLDPDNVSLYDKLEHIYKREDNWAAMADVLTKKSALDLPDKTIIQTASQAADIYERRLEQPENAIALWQKVLALDESNNKAFSRLTDILVAHRKFDDLESLYEQREVLDRYHGILQAVASEATENDEKQEVYRRMATLSEQKLDEPLRVIAALESLLDVSADRRAVATELIGWYRKQGQMDKEIEMHKLLLELAPDDDARFDELRALAELEIQREKDGDALRWLFEAIRVRPNHEETIETTEALAKHVDVLGDFLDHLEIIAESREDAPELQEQLWSRVARLARDEQEDTARAIELYERLHQRKPEELDTLHALESLYDKAHEPEKRIAALTTVIGLLQEQNAPEQQIVGQMVKIASVQHRHLRQTEEAQQTYMRVLDVEPDDMTAIAGLRDLFMEQQRWGDVIDMIQREYTLTSLDDDAKRNQLRSQLATIHQEQLDDPAQALVHYGDILGESPDHEATLEQVESLLDDERVARDAALMIEPLFRSGDAPQRLAVALEARHKVCQDTFEEQEILEELVPLYIEQLEDRPSAFPWAARRFELDASNHERWQEMETLGEQLDRWQDVEALFSQYAPFEDDSEHAERFELLRRVAVIRETHLQDQPGALDAWKRLYHYERADLSVVDNLDRLYRALGEHDALISTLEAKSALKDDPQEQAEILLEAGTLADSVLEDTDKAVGLYQQVLGIDESNDRAVDELIRLFAQQENWQALDDLYAEQAQLNVDKRRTFILSQATLRTQYLNDPDGAFDLLKQLLSENTADEQALDVLIEVDAQLEGKDPKAPLRLDIAMEMERIYRELNNYPNLIQVLETRLTFTDDPYERLALFDELAELYLGRVGDKNLSFDRTRDAVVLMPDEEERRERLERLAEDLGRYADVVNAYDEASKNTSDPFVQAALFKRMGQLQVSALGEDDKAIVSYERALEVEESDVPTLKAVEALYMKTSAFEQLSDNLNKQVQYVEFDERPTLLRRIGDLEENLNRPIEAIGAYERLRELEPEALDGLDALERLYEREQNWVELADLLTNKARLLEEKDAKLSTLYKLAQTHQHKLDNPSEAILTYQQMREHEPLQVEALEALDALYLEDKQFVELGEVLRAKLQLPDAQNDPQLREELELRLADILAEQRESDEAVDFYLGVFQRNPGQAQALGALDNFVRDIDYTERISPSLTQYYQGNEQWDRLVDLKQVQRDLSDAPEQQAQLNWEIAKIYDGFMEERQPDAIDAMADAWRLQPYEDQYLGDLLALSAQAGAWTKLTGVFEDVIMDMGDYDRQKGLRVQLAQIYRDQLQDYNSAEDQFNEALNQDERDVSIYDALQNLYLSQERWFDLIQLLQRRYDVFANEPNAKIYLLQIAQIQDERIPNGSIDAVATYRRVLDEIDPRDEQADEEVQRLYREQQNWIELSDYLNAKLPLWSEDYQAQIDIKRQLADVYQVHLNEPEQALQLHSEVLQAVPNDAQTITSLEALFADQLFLREEIAGLLEPLYRQSEQWDKLIHVLRTKANAESDPFTKTEILQDIARVCEQHKSPRDYPQALETYGEIFKLTPDNAQARTSLFQVAERLRAWPRFVELYEETFRDAYGVDDALAARLRLELAHVREDRLEDLDAARDTYYQVFEFDNENKEAVSAIVRLNMRKEDWIDLAEFYDKRAEAEYEPERRGMWLEMLAVLYEESLEDNNSAIDTYKRTLEVMPGRRSLQSALARLLRSTGNFEDLADAYLGFIEQTEDEDDRIMLQFTRAQLLESELDRIDEAIEVYRDVLLQRPGHRETLNELEGLRRDLNSRDFDWSTQVAQIVDLLLEHYDVASDWRRVAELYLHKQEVMELPDERRELLFQAASLYEQHGEDRTDAADAINIYAQAYAMQPAQPDALAKIEQLAAGRESWERVVPVLLAEVERREDPIEQSAILTAVARIYRNNIEDPRSALVSYEQALELDSENTDAMDELEGLYGQFDHWDALVQLLRKRLEQTYDGAVRVNLLQRIANVYDRVLNQPDEAITAYEELREQDPSDLTYLDALARLYEMRERDFELEEVLKAQANLQDDDAKRLGTLKKLAVVQREILDNKDGAIETYRNILSVDEEDEQAVEALVELYTENNAWQELYETLMIKLDFAASIEDANAIELQIADLLKTHLYQPVDALERYAKIARRTPEWAPPVEALTAMMEEPDAREDAFLILEEVHTEHQRWEPLADTYQKRLAYLDDVFTAGETYTKLAQVQEFQLQTPTRAFMTYGRAFCMLPDQEELQGELERLGRTVGSADELVGVYEDALDRDINDPIVLQRIHTRLGELYYDELDQAEPAMSHMEKVLSIDDRDAKALNLLDRLYKANERWEDLADVLERKLSVVNDDELAEVRFRLGELRETRFNRPFDALDLYREVITAQPDHRGTIEALERMIENHEDLRIDLFDLLENAYTRTDAHAKLSELFKYKLEVVNAPHERAELMRRIADLEIHKLDRMQVGFGFLARALSEDPLEVDIQTQLEGLANTHQEDWMWEELVARYEDIIDALDDPLRRSELALPAAGWAKDKLGAYDRATALYGLVLDFDQQHEGALLALETMAREQNQPVALAEVLKRKVDILYDDTERFNAFAELGQVYVQLEKYDQAIEALREAWLLDQQNVQVMNALATLYEATERHDDHVEMLEHMISVTTDEQERLDLLVTMGNLCAEKLEQPARAIGALEQAQQIHPDHVPVLRALETLYEQSEDYHNLSQNLDRQMELAQDDNDRVRVLVRRAQLAYKQSNDAELAISLFQKAQQIDPNHSLIHDSLDELYRKEERWVDVFNLYYNRLQTLTDASERAELAVDMAALSHGKLGDSNTAVQYIDFARQTDPNNLRALQTLEQIYLDAGDLPQVAQVMGMQLDLAQTADDKITIYRRRAKLNTDQLQNPQGAVDDLVQALNLKPEDGEVFVELKQLLETYKSWEQLYDVLQFRTQIVPEDERKGIYLEMAQVAENMDDAARRVQALELIYQTAPDDLEVIQPLLDAYIAGNYFDKAEPLLAQVISTLREKRMMRDVVKFLHLQGKLAEQKGDNTSAMTAYEEAHKIDASYLPNLLSLGKLSYYTGDLDRARTLFQTMQLHQMNIKDNRMKVDMFYYLGMVRLSMGEAKRAQDMFKRVLRIDPNHEPTKQQLDALG